MLAHNSEWFRSKAVEIFDAVVIVTPNEKSVFRLPEDLALRVRCLQQGPKFEKPGNRFWSVQRRH